MNSLKQIMLVPDWLKSSLNNKDFPIVKLATLMAGIKEGTATIDEVRNAPMSIKTIYELMYLNTLMDRILSKPYTDCSYCGGIADEVKHNLTVDMEKDCRNTVRAHLHGNSYDDCCSGSSGSTSKYYEIQTTPEGVMVILVCPGFLNFLVETKGNFDKFILECLELTYNYSPATVDQAITRLLGAFLYYDTNNNFKQTFKANLTSFLL